MVERSRATAPGKEILLIILDAVDGEGKHFHMAGRRALIPTAESNDLFTTRHPGEGRGPVPRLAERKNWIPAFAGMTVQAASNGTKLLATAIHADFRRTYRCGGLESDFRQTRNVKERHIVREHPGKIGFLLVHRPECYTKDEQFRSDFIHRWISPGLQVCYVYVNRIECEGIGKFVGSLLGGHTL